MGVVKRIRRRRAYSLIAEKGHKSEKVSPLQSRFTQEKASWEVCAKEGRNLMKRVGGAGAAATGSVNSYVVASLKSSLCAHNQSTLIRWPLVGLWTPCNSVGLLLYPLCWFILLELE